MLKRNVPLNALRAFEAAARHLSFTLAAQELNVTQVAVSKQVKLLEDYLETQLFVRKHRSLALTAEGKRLHPILTRAFDEIYAGIDLISMRGRRDVVSVQAYTTFAQRWLIPRLNKFHSHHPEIEVRISASLQPADFSSGTVQAAIRSGSGSFPGCESQHLLPIILVPVCRPDLVGELNSPADLRRHTLIHSLARRDDWATWLKSAGYGDLDCTRHMKLENSTLCYEAAMEGIGIAMGILPLVLSAIESGKLAIPFRQTVETGEGYSLIWPSGRPMRGSVTAFHRWLVSEAALSVENANALERQPGYLPA